MTIITIGGKPYGTSPMNFKRLKQAWPLIMAGQEMTDPMESMEQSIALFSLALAVNHPEMTPDTIQEQILSTELSGLKDAMTSILTENDMTKGDTDGLKKTEGAAPSTETSTGILSNSSQPASVEAAGIE